MLGGDPSTWAPQPEAEAEVLEITLEEEPLPELTVTEEEYIIPDEE